MHDYIHKYLFVFLLNFYWIVLLSVSSSSIYLNLVEDKKIERSIENERWNRRSLMKRSLYVSFFFFLSSLQVCFPRRKKFSSNMIKREQNKIWLKNFIQLPYWYEFFVSFLFFTITTDSIVFVSLSIHLLANINTYYIEFQRIIIDTCNARRRRCFTMLFVVLFIVIQQILQINQKLIEEVNRFHHQHWCHVIITHERVQIL